MQRNHIDQTPLFVAQTRPFSLNDLIDNMNKQYMAYQQKHGADSKPNWILESHSGNIETPSAHHKIYYGNFFQHELWNFFAEHNAQPEKKTEGDKNFLIITDSHLKNANISKQAAGHFLFAMHKKLTEMHEYPKSFTRSL